MDFTYEGVFYNIVKNKEQTLIALNLKPCTKVCDVYLLGTSRKGTFYLIRNLADLIADAHIGELEYDDRNLHVKKIDKQTITIISKVFNDYTFEFKFRIISDSKVEYVENSYQYTKIARKP